MKRLLLLTLLTINFASYAADASSSSASSSRDEVAAILDAHDDPSLEPEARFRRLMQGAHIAMRMGSSKPEEAMEFADQITQACQSRKSDDAKQEDIVARVHTVTEANLHDLGVQPRIGGPLGEAHNTFMRSAAMMKAEIRALRQALQQTASTQDTVKPAVQAE